MIVSAQSANPSSFNNEFFRQQELQKQFQEQQKAPQNFEQKNVNASSEVIFDEKPCFVIQKIDISNSENLPISLGFTTFINQCLGKKGIEKLVQNLNHQLIDAGYSTSRILISPQNIASGTLQLQFQAGTIQNITFSDETNAPFLWNARPLRLTSGEILSLSAVEQMMDNLKRLPSVQAQMTIVPSQKQKKSNQKPNQQHDDKNDDKNTKSSSETSTSTSNISSIPIIPTIDSDVKIQYQQAFPLRFSLGIDDSGTQSLGKYQGTVSVAFDNFLGLSDILAISLTQDLNQSLGSVISGNQGYEAIKNNGSRNRNFHYSIPFGYWNFAVSNNFSRYHQTVYGAFSNYVYAGENEQWNINLERLLHRNQNSKTFASGGISWREMKQFIDNEAIDVQYKRIGGWDLGLRHQRQLSEEWHQGMIEFSAQYKAGTGLANAQRPSEELFGEGSSRYRLWTADIRTQLPLHAEKKWKYNGYVRYQKANTPLLIQDRFAIGNRFTVRGFDGNMILSGERGHIVKQDFSYQYLGEHELYFGADYGKVSGPSTQFLLGKNLTGGFLGLRGKFDSYKGLTYDTFISMPITKPQGFKTASVNAGFNINWGF